MGSRNKSRSRPTKPTEPECEEPYTGAKKWASENGYVVYDDEWEIITKVDENIYFGAALPVQSNSDEFVKLNFDLVINMAREIHYKALAKIEVAKYEIGEYDDCSFMWQMDKVCAKIDESVRAGKRIYIHCAFAKSRAPAIIMYYLMMHRNMDYYAAHDLIMWLRPTIKLVPGVEMILRNVCCRCHEDPEYLECSLRKKIVKDVVKKEEVKEVKE